MIQPVAGRSRIAFRNASLADSFVSGLSQAHHVFHQYVIRAERRDELRKFLTDRRSGPKSIIRFRCTCNPASLISDIAKATSRNPSAPRAMCWLLPMFPELTDEEQR